MIQMTKGYLLLPCILLLSTTTTTISARRDMPVEQVIEVKEDNTFTIRLDQTPSTGYSWQFAKPFNSTYLQLVKQSDLPKRNIPGAPVTHEWLFKAIKRGQTEIILEYVRPWEKQKSNNSQKREYTVIIKR